MRQKDLTKKEATVLQGKLLRFYRKQHRAKYQAQWDEGVITHNDLTMKFFAKIPPSYKTKSLPLFISLHGGGGTTATVNDQQWENQKRLYNVGEALYVVPRAPTNTWDLWHQGHIDPMFQEIIKGAILCYNVDPNKVYVIGYSAGGDGTYQLGPRMADQWAGVGMMAGHPGDANILNLMNTYFSIYMGANDRPYDRNKHAQTWKDELKKLTQEYPGSFKHDVDIYQTGHWMNGKDAVAIPRLLKHTRTPYPKRVFWIQDNVTHDRFYWLSLPQGTAKAGSVVKANIKGQTITIEETKDITTLTIYLNDHLLDLNKPVNVVYQGHTIFQNKVPRKLETIEKTLSDRYDIKGTYTAEITLTL